MAVAKLKALILASLNSGDWLSTAFLAAIASLLFNSTVIKFEIICLTFSNYLIISNNITSSCSLLGMNILIVLYFFDLLIFVDCFLEGAKIIKITFYF